MAKKLRKHCKAISPSIAPICHNCGERIASGPSDATASPSSSLTPETDAMADEIYANGIRVSEIRMLQHARKMERERNKAILALMGAECLATAWVAYWTSSPAYGNGTQHPKHTALLKQVREAYPENADVESRR